MSNHEQPPAGEDDTVIHVDFTRDKAPIAGQGLEGDTQPGLVTPMSQDEVMAKVCKILRNPKYDSVVVTRLNLNSDPDARNVLPFHPPNKCSKE